MNPNMYRRQLFAILGLLLITLSACSSTAIMVRSPGHGPRVSATPAETPADQYIAHIAFLAHDELKGRATGSDGIDLAAGYIAGQFAAAGLIPGGPNGTYFQEYTIERPAELNDDTSLAVQANLPDGEEINAELAADFTPFGFSAQGPFAGEVVFVGYGISYPAKNHDDYANVEVKGRVLLMLRREPPGLNPDGYTEHARFDHKIKLAAEKGASAVLIVNQDPGEDGIDGLMRFTQRDDYGIPAMHVKRNLADKLLSAGGLQSITHMQKQLDDEGKNVSAPLTSVRVSGTFSFDSVDLLARNVIGVLPGMGPHADQYVVIGAHYDHLGERRGEIHNGADDNASGTAGVIEMAWSMGDLAHRDRSVIFMAFSGEEIGLEGSKYYTRNPTVAIESIVAMLNMDMIGRLSDEEANMLAIQGLGTGDAFQQIVATRAAEAGIDFLPDPSAKGPSDHAPFYHAGIPALFFFTGVHDDYHAPGDDTEKVNAEGAVKIVGLASRIALDIVNRENAPKYSEVEERANIFRGAQSSRSRVIMGIMPDMDDQSDDPGWGVGRVFPGSGAAKAGMKSGDRILRIEDTTIGGMDDYRKVTADKNPGDVISVTVLRAGKEHSLEVKLSDPGEMRERMRALRGAGDE